MTLTISIILWKNSRLDLYKNYILSELLMVLTIKKSLVKIITKSLLKSSLKYNIFIMIKKPVPQCHHWWSSIIIFDFPKLSCNGRRERTKGESYSLPFYFNYSFESKLINFIFMGRVGTSLNFSNIEFISLRVWIH